MPKFPDRWFDYANTGDVIQGTKLITFKVPLKESFFANNKNIPEDSRFTPTTLLQSIRDRGLKLGLVVDLTFTSRYYDPAEFTSQGVQYQKIFVEGHVIPKMEVIEKFYETVDKFLENSEEDSLVGVHCTHGVNRTGYVVCRYMVERLGMKATQALEAYKVARGYAVERVNYINDLKKRAGKEVEEEEETEQSPHRSSSRGHRHGHGHTHGRGGGDDSGPNYRGRGHHQNGRWSENPRHQHYDQGAEQWGNHNGQFAGRGARGWAGNQYGADHAGYQYNYSNGYDTNNWRQQQRPYHTNRDDGYQSYNRGHHSAHGNGYNQHWGGGAHGDWRNSYDPHIHSNGYSDNSRHGSYNRRSYSRQNSSDSRTEGRGSRGRGRQRQY